MLEQALNELGIKVLKHLLQESGLVASHVGLMEGIGPIAMINDDTVDCGFRTVGFKINNLGELKLINVEY